MKNMPMKKGIGTGFVLIHTMPTKENEVFKALSAIPEVKEKVPLFGEYDIIIRVEMKREDLGPFVVDRIRTIEGVVDTKTLVTTKF